MDITITLTDADVTALTADLTTHTPDAPQVPDLAVVLPQLIHSQIVRPAVLRQIRYGQARRIDRLERASPEVLAAVDAALAPVVLLRGVGR